MSVGAAPNLDLGKRTRELRWRNPFPSCRPIVASLASPEAEQTSKHPRLGREGVTTAGWLGTDKVGAYVARSRSTKGG